MKIGVISDTHGKVHPRVREVFAGVDHILHAGDIGGEAVLRELKAIAPVTAAAGNVDGFACGDAGEEAFIELEATLFYITHIVGRPSQPTAAVQKAIATKRPAFVIFGHSHLPHDEKIDGTWYFNPASAGPRRFDYPVSVGMIESDGKGWSTRHLALDDRSVAALANHMNALSLRR